MLISLYVEFSLISLFELNSEKIREYPRYDEILVELTCSAGQIIFCIKFDSRITSLKSVLEKCVVTARVTAGEGFVTRQSGGAQQQVISLDNN